MRHSTVDDSLYLEGDVPLSNSPGFRIAINLIAAMDRQGPTLIVLAKYAVNTG